MICLSCGTTINPLRLKALPTTRTCVGCSTQDKWYTRNIISGKTDYSELEVIKDSDTASRFRQMDKRSGWGSNLVKVSR